MTLAGGVIRADEEPDDNLVDLLQVANQQLDADAPPPLRLETTEPIDPDRDAKAAVAFFAILILYGQLLTYGYWVAAGVVEEKSSRVIEVLLATIRPKDLLAGKVIGLGLLGSRADAARRGPRARRGGGDGRAGRRRRPARRRRVSRRVVPARLRVLRAAFAVAGALVPRQEELQSSTTPLTMLILISLFAGFIVTGDPEGTLAHVCAFIPTTAPITMPGRIILGAAPAWEIAASVAVMIAATMALIPLAARIYAAVVLRTGSSVKLSEALRLARR